MLYQSILLPIDISHPEHSTALFEKVAALLAPGGRMLAVYVVPEIPAYVTIEMSGDFLPVMIRKAEKSLRDIVAEANLPADTRILTGQAHRAILATAESEKCDLIVVSSHRPGMGDYFLGSTAARVVRHAQCSVLVIR